MLSNPLPICTRPRAISWRGALDALTLAHAVISETNQFISSRFVKQIARLGGDVSSFVSPNVRAELEAVRGR